MVRLKFSIKCWDEWFEWGFEISVWWYMVIMDVGDNIEMRVLMIKRGYVCVGFFCLRIMLCVVRIIFCKIVKCEEEKSEEVGIGWVI